MLNHTLMQTIARANRDYRDEVNGLIVDYVGMFRNLEKTLALAFVCRCRTIGVAKKIRALVPPAYIGEVMNQVEELLDESIATDGYVIRDGGAEKYAEEH